LVAVMMVVGHVQGGGRRSRSIIHDVSQDRS
jgi:hypothetical protein